MFLCRSREVVQTSLHELLPVYMECDIVIFKVSFAYAVQHDNCVYYLYAILWYLAYMVQSCKTIALYFLLTVRFSVSIPGERCLVMAEVVVELSLPHTFMAYSVGINKFF